MTNDPPMEWQPIDGYEVEVSNEGIVRNSVTKHPLGQYLSDSEYYLVRLSNGTPEGRREERVHRLVAKAFVPNPENKPVVNHIDCNTKNNHAWNLEWCTQSENVKHSRDLGRYPDDYWKGKRSPNASLSDEDAQEIRDKYAAGGHSHQSLADEYGTSKRTVGRIVKGDTYKPPPPLSTSRHERAG